MKKTLILLSILAVITVFYYFFVLNKNSGKKDIESRKFVIENIDDIYFVTIKGKGYPQMHLEKKGKDHWILNEKYLADNHVVNNLTGVLTKMEIKYLPTHSLNKNVVQNLDKVGIDIKAYDKHGNVLTDFIMGGNDNAEGASFCVRRGYDQAYAMHVQVTEGGLRNYFDQTQLSLRDKGVFDISPDNLKSFKIEYLKDKKNSFEIKVMSGKYTFSAVETFNQLKSNVNENTVDAFVKSIDKLNCEAIRTGEMKIDSIRQFVPFALMSFELNNGKKEQYEFYPLIDILDNSINTQTIDDLNKRKSNFFVFSDLNEAYSVQHRLVEKYFQPIHYFYN